MIEVDGSHGEGGGQILRTALALSCVTARPFRMVRIRQGRARPGLQPQHLASVRAAAAVCGARVLGDARGSTELRFEPGPLRGGDRELDVGTAGSVALVLQTVLPALLFAPEPSRIRLSGGTHVPFSPPFTYVTEVFAPVLQRLGAHLSLRIERCGFYPRGGGLVTAAVRPAGGLRPLRMVDRGALLRIAGISAVGRLPLAIAERQRDSARDVLREGLGEDAPVAIAAREVAAPSPGTFVFLRGEWEGGPAGFSALGARGRRAEAVGEEAARALLGHAATRAPVDPHLADQLVPYLALAAGLSEIATSCVTRHLVTNLWTVRRFLPVEGEVRGEEGAPGRLLLVGVGAGRPAGMPVDEHPADGRRREPQVPPPAEAAPTK